MERRKENGSVKDNKKQTGVDLGSPRRQTRKGKHPQLKGSHSREMPLPWGKNQSRITSAFELSARLWQQVLLQNLHIYDFVAKVSP